MNKIIKRMIPISAIICVGLVFYGLTGDPNKDITIPLRLFVLSYTIFVACIGFLVNKEMN